MDDDEDDIPLGDEFPGLRIATRGKRIKSWGIEAKFNGLFGDEWMIWKRYETQVQRDKALAHFEKQARGYVRYRAC